MQPDFVLMTRAALTSYDALNAPVWIFDLDHGVKWWANRSAVTLWGAASLEELLKRDARKQMSEAIRTRLQQYRARFQRGETVSERWTFYPDGKPPMVADCICSGIAISDEQHGARLAMLIEARVRGPDEHDPAERRGVEALRHSSEMVMLCTIEGRALMRNPAAVRALGDAGAPGSPPDELAAMFADSAEAARARAIVNNGEVYSADAEVRTVDGVRVHHIEMRPTLDPVTGERAILVNQRDVSERIQYARELEQSRQSLLQQAEELRALSSPVIRLWRGILALPLIGRISSERVAGARGALLPQVTAEHVKTVIVELTGAATLDPDAASAIRDLARTLKLLGVSVLLTGLSPTLATTMVKGGMVLADLRAHKTVELALRARGMLKRSQRRAERDP